MKPKPIDKVNAAFGVGIKDYMPTNEEMEDYRKNWHNGNSWGFNLFNEWFYFGIKALQLMPKPDIDPKAALSHIRTIMASFEPKHEDKTAACAYLFEHWFESTTWSSLKEKE